MAKKTEKNNRDTELQNAAIALLETGDDEGCDGNVVVQVEEFRKLQELIKDRTGETYGSVSDDNVSNFSDEDDDEDDEDDEDEDDFEEEEDDDYDDEDDDEDDDDDENDTIYE